MMKAHTPSRKLIKTYCHSIIICLFMIISASLTSSQNVTCPFQYVYHFGDGTTDIGNSIRVLPFGPSLPAARLPYGKTFPGRPTGRWSDGLIDFDFAAIDLGLPNIVPYLSMNASINYDGVIFSVARSPVLDRNFFKFRGIQIPPYAVPLNGQLSWFKSFLKSVCSTQQDCANRLNNSLMLMGDIEANDIGYPLTQGKSIKEVQTYVPFVIRALIGAATELIRMGATQVIFPGNAPLGCYPYILTALRNNNPTSYDDLGCLKSVNDLILSKNKNLQEAIQNLSTKFPNVSINYADVYGAVRTIIQQSSTMGPQGNMALKACCGTGGIYNYNSRRFCGSPGVPVCANPNQSIYWDGLHFTQEAYARYVDILIPPALSVLNCTTN